MAMPQIADNFIKRGDGFFWRQTLRKRHSRWLCLIRIHLLTRPVSEPLQPAYSSSSRSGTISMSMWTVLISWRADDISLLQKS